MAIIVTRSGKGSPLTNNEVDANFTNLNTELGTKASTSLLATVATTGAYADLTGKPTIASADGSVTVTGTTNIDLSVPITAETKTVILPVRNNTGATLVKGTAVYINGALGQNPTVTKAIATGDATSAQTLGLITADLANNSVGNVTLIGTLTNVDTSAFTDGAQLYLSPTTAGALTATKPYAPSHLVYMAVVEHAHPSLGKLFVKVQNGYEMDELHNVAAQSPANNDGLFYNTSTSLWEKKSIVTALGYTPYNATNPAGYTSNVGTVTSVSGTGTVSGLTLSGTVTGSGNLTLGGTLSLTSGNVTTALGYTPYNSTNPAGYITGITSGNVTTALGYTPYNASNPSGYITSSALSPYALLSGAAFTGSISTTGSVTIGGGGAYQAGSIYSDGNWGMIFRAKQASPVVADFLWTNSADVERLRISNFGNVIAAIDVRAPIFYDSNNTGYYINPNGASQVSGANFNFGATGRVYDDGNFHIDGVSSPVWINSLSNNTIELNTQTSGYVNIGNSARAPIFYDSNNTGYYLDPAGSSVLGIITAQSTNDAQLYLNGNGTSWAGIQWTDVSASDNMWYNGSTSTFAIGGGGSFVANKKLHINGGTTIGSGIAASASGTNSLLVEASITANQMYSQIFYDSQNGAYYVDPASTSNLRGLTLTDGSASMTFSSTSSGRSGAFGMTDAYNMYLNAPTNGVLYLSSFQAPIMYDRDNSAYYVDPASTSNLAGLTVANRITGSVTGCTFTQDSQDQDNITLRTDSGFYQSSTGTNAEGWPLNDSGWQHMISCTHTNDGNYFAMQLAAGFFSTGLFYRSVNNNGAQAWSRVALYDNGYAAPLYASIYYDANDTAYYLNPNGTSVLQTVSLGAQTWRGDITWNTAVNVVIPASAECSFDVNSSGTWQVWDLTSNAPMIKATAGTNVEIGGAGSRGLYVYGGITATGNVTAFSDIRIKANVETIPSALDKLDQIRGVTYTRTDLDDKEQRYAGVIAQEIEAVLPEAVRDLGDIKAVDYNATIALLIQAVKELRDEVEMLRK